MANGDDRLADHGIIVITEKRQKRIAALLCFNLNERQVELTLGGEDFTGDLDLVAEQDFDGAMGADHMAIRDDQSAGRNDDSGSSGVLLALTRDADANDGVL